MPTFRFIAVAVLALATLVTSQGSWGDGSPRSNGFSSNYRQDNSDVVRRYNHEVPIYFLKYEQETIVFF